MKETILIANAKYEFTEVSQTEVKFKLLQIRDMTAKGTSHDGVKLEIPSRVKLRNGKIYDVGYIAKNSFSGVSDSISIVVIPDTIHQISSMVFTELPKLREIEVSPGNLWFRSIDGVLYSKDSKKLHCFPGAKATCSDDNSLGQMSFKMPESVVNICENAFCANGYVTEIICSDKITQIFRRTFDNLPQLRRLYLPKSLRKIEFCDDDYCERLEAIEITDQNQRYETVDGLLYDKAEKSLVKCPAGKKGCIKVRDTTVSLTYWTFADCKDVTEILLPEGLKEIMSYAFENCSGLTAMFIPASVTVLGSFIFYGCINLERVFLSRNITNRIDSRTFLECTSLRKIYLCENTEVDKEDIKSFLPKVKIITYPAAKEQLYIDRWNKQAARNRGAKQVPSSDNRRKDTPRSIAKEQTKSVRPHARPIDFGNFGVNAAKFAKGAVACCLAFGGMATMFFAKCNNPRTEYIPITVEENTTSGSANAYGQPEVVSDNSVEVSSSTDNVVRDNSDENVQGQPISPVYGNPSAVSYPNYNTSNDIVTEQPVACEPKRYDCPYCVDGRITHDDNAPANFGIEKPKEYCSECGKWYDPNLFNHYHTQCTHCGGNGYLTYD